MSKKVDKKEQRRAIIDALRTGSDLPFPPSVPTPKKLVESTSSVQKIDEVTTHLSGRELAQSPVNNNTNQTDQRSLEKETNDQVKEKYTHSADSLENARKSLQSNQSILNWFEQRGISKALLFHLQAGLTKDNQLIFPCSLTSWYSCRVTIPSDQDQVVDIELGSPTFCGEGLGVFGMKNAIKSLDKTVFIARSLLDALSIIETGNLAIFATEGKNDDLIEFCKANPGTSTYESYKNNLISLLYEAHPNFAKNQILSRNLTCVSISQIPQQYKSLNEILVADRSNFLTFLNAHKNAHKD